MLWYSSISYYRLSSAANTKIN